MEFCEDFLFLEDGGLVCFYSYFRGREWGFGWDILGGRFRWKR